MLRQPELFESEFRINPLPGSKAPRLWIKRLVIWSEPGKVVRDIELRPGLNIIWTPDDQGIGHGGGKTLFSRLIRYCMGEDRFAPEDHRNSIAAAFPNGLIGAEAILDGTQWTIVRPLGIRRRHIAVVAPSVYEVDPLDAPANDLEPFRKAIENAFIGPGVQSLISGTSNLKTAWPIALAWLTRDQECRFDHVLDWRAATSDSDSPVRALDKSERLNALRAFLQAITADELTCRNDVNALDSEKREMESSIGHRAWEIARTKGKLITALNLREMDLPPGDLMLEAMRRAAHTRITAAAQLPLETENVDIQLARRTYEEAVGHVSALRKELAGYDAQIPVMESLRARIAGELPGLDYALKEAGSFPCPICEVPIDRVLADKCKLSHKLPDLESCRKRLERTTQEYKHASDQLDETKALRGTARKTLASAEARADARRDQLHLLEAARDAREKQWDMAQQLKRDVEHLASLASEQALEEVKLAQTQESIESRRGSIGAFIDKQNRVISNVGERFDQIIRFIVGDEAGGRVTLDGNGLHLAVEMGGNRSTSAIDSLKVIAFDLAALILSIEGATKVPAFLLHDSPREADLGLPLYHRIFELLNWLESAGGTPLFQYIITTTTPPPDPLRVAPWLRLRLLGSPSRERLLCRDL